MSRVAINVCLNQIETERIRPELRYADLSLEERKAVKQFASSFAEIPEEQRELAREVVTTLLLKLEPEDRLVITMLHLEKRCIAEIASYTGRTAGVIKTRAYRARQKLKRLHGQLIKQNLRETCSHSAGKAFQPEE